MRVTIDGLPFAGLGLTGYIPGGDDVFTGVADNNGTIAFDNIVMPFVKNGSMMYVSPNLGRVLNSNWRVGIKDFNIKLKNDLNQTFFFKIIKPSFSLTYEAANTDPTIRLPADIASGASIKRFLTDSCFFQPVSGAAADLNITIKCQVASAASSDMETGEARFTGNVSIQAPMLSPPRTEQEGISFEKKYDKVPDVPLGPFSGTRT